MKPAEISEKTVELNVTAELLGWLGYVKRRSYVALAPSQQQEGRLGYDVGYYGDSWPVALIQYKRAYVNRAGVWEWRLNRTKRRDQHSRLRALETAGFPVFYAFPYFSTPQEVYARRRHLLSNVFWYPPAFITPKGPIDDHHEVCLDPASGRWWVKSTEPVDLRDPLSISAVVQAGDQMREQEQRVDVVIGSVNAILLRLSLEDVEPPGLPRVEADGDEFDSQALVTQYQPS